MGCFLVCALLLLLVDGVRLSDWVEFLSLVLLTRVFFDLIIIASVVGMPFADTLFVAN